MTNKNTDDTGSRIEGLINSGNFKEAAALLRAEFSARHDLAGLAYLEETMNHYRLMLDFFLSGGEDPTREVMYSKISIRLLTSLADLRRHSRVEDGKDFYASKARFEKIQGKGTRQRLEEYESLKMVAQASVKGSPEFSEAMRNAEDALTRLFYNIWTAPTLDISLIARETKNADDFILQAQVINALLLRGLEYFDYDIIFYLADIAESAKSERLTARSLVAALLLLMRHSEKLRDNKMIQNRLLMWQDNLLMYTRLRDAVRAIIRTRDTQRISETMKTDVIPEIMKMRPEIMKKMKDFGADIESGAIDANPEWEEMFEKSGLSERLRELSELQSEGADIMMLAFSNLKGFPFFRELANWFLPFSSTHSSVLALENKDASVIETLLSGGALICDSDKFSLAMAMVTMPKAQREMMFSQFMEQIEQHKEELKNHNLKSSLPEFDMEANMYVRDLYRFFKLNERRGEFRDPFARPFNFMEVAVIRDILAESDILDTICEFYFRRGYYREALPMLEIQLEKEGIKSEILEKIGFCHQKNGEIAEALSAYEKATMAYGSKESKWLTRKLAICNRLLGNFGKAADLYRDLLDADPDNVSLINGRAFCLSAKGEYGEALKLYYKSDYLLPGKKEVARAIAWNEMMSRHFDKSSKWHAKVLETSSDARDFLNSGHNSFLKGDIRQAAYYYHNSLLKFGSASEFRKAFEADVPVLEQLGACRLDLRLVREAVSD